MSPFTDRLAYRMTHRLTHRLRALISPLAALGACLLPLQTQAADLTLERITADPPLAGSLPRQAEVSPGGNWVSYLRPSAADSEQLELWLQPRGGGPARRLAGAGCRPGQLWSLSSGPRPVSRADLRVGRRSHSGHRYRDAFDRRRCGRGIECRVPV